MRIGVDLGGTKIEAAVVDANGDITLRRRVATPRGDYEATLHAIARIVSDLERDNGGQASVGIGIPGTISPATGLVKNANSVWLIGRPLDRDLSALMNRPLRFANDANCFALSEAHGGAAANARTVFGVIVGTGTGGGLVVDGKALLGANAIAGEWGHNPLPWPKADELPGAKCYCGLRGCIETFLSGPGLERDFRNATGMEMSSAKIVEAAQRGDRAANAALERYEDRMARALSSIINVFDPHVIVLGGGMSNISRLYTNVPGLLGQYAAR